MYVIVKYVHAETRRIYGCIVLAGLMLVGFYIIDLNKWHSGRYSTRKRDPANWTYWPTSSFENTNSTYQIPSNGNQGVGNPKLAPSYIKFVDQPANASLQPDRIRHIKVSFKIDDVRDTSPIKKILLWTPYYKFRHFGFILGESGFSRYGCDVKRCTVTEDKRELASADAVVFHGAELPVNRSDIPKHAHQGQVFVFVLHESPARLQPNKLANLTDIFNLTVTYMNSEDTDIPTPYGVIKPRSKIVPQVIPSEATVNKKSKLIAWIVSNCHPRSSRVEYADELRKYVQVDTYGKCGNLSCPKSDPVCFSKIVREHFFMFSFENSYCTDYATEKLFRPLDANVVPITLGRADYSSMLPAKSYIDVRDFKSPKHLAEYLTYLQGNHTAYREYFGWKERYVVLSHTYTRPKSFCRLCEILHDDKYKFKRSFDPEFFWQAGRHCLSMDREREEIHLK